MAGCRNFDRQGRRRRGAARRRSRARRTLWGDAGGGRAVRRRGSAPGRGWEPAGASPATRSAGRWPPAGSSIADSIVTRGSQSRNDGRHQFQSPSRRIDGRQQDAPDDVASTKTATARPSPSCWIDRELQGHEDREDDDHDRGRAGDRPGGDRDPVGDGARRVEAAVAGLLDPGQDEEVVVHREAEHDREDEQRHEALDDRAGRDPDRVRRTSRPGRRGSGSRRRRPSRAG